MEILVTSEKLIVNLPAFDFDFAFDLNFEL